MKKCALVIGHKKTSPGASNNASGLTEFVFNDALAQDIENAVSGVEVQKYIDELTAHLRKILTS